MLDSLMIAFNKVLARILEQHDDKWGINDVRFRFAWDQDTEADIIRFHKANVVNLDHVLAHLKRRYPPVALAETIGYHFITKSAKCLLNVIYDSANDIVSTHWNESEFFNKFLSDILWMRRAIGSICDYRSAWHVTIQRAFIQQWDLGLALEWLVSFDPVWKEQPWYDDVDKHWEEILATTSLADSIIWKLRRRAKRLARWYFKHGLINKAELDFFSKM